MGFAARESGASSEMRRRSSASSSSSSSCSAMGDCAEEESSVSASGDGSDGTECLSNGCKESAAGAAKAFTEVISGCLCATRPVFCCGGRVLACARGEEVCLYSAQTGELLYCCEGHESKLCALIAVPAKVFRHLPSMVISFGVSGEVCCWEVHSRPFFYASLDEHQRMRSEEPLGEEEKAAEAGTPSAAPKVRMRSLNCLRALRLDRPVLTASLAALSAEVVVLTSRTPARSSGESTERRRKRRASSSLFSVVALPLTELVSAPSEEAASASAASACAGRTEALSGFEELFSFETLPSAMAVASSGGLVGVTSERQLLLFVRKKQLLLRLHHVDPLLQVSIHPQELFIAAGDTKGRIVLFYVSHHKTKTASEPLEDEVPDGEGASEASRKDSGVSRDESSSAHSGEDKERVECVSLNASTQGGRRRRRGVRCSVQTVVLHWHAHAVNSLCFSADGLMLLSGGEEGVLVFWQMQHNFSKIFLPRLGAALLHLAPAWIETQLLQSPAALAGAAQLHSQNERKEHVAVACADNRIKVVDGATLEGVGCVNGVAMPLAAFSLDLNAASAAAMALVRGEAMKQVEEKAEKALLAGEEAPSRRRQSLPPQLLFEELSYKPADSELLTPGIALSPFPGQSGAEEDGELVLVCASESALQVLDLESGAEAFRIDLQRRTYTSRIDESFGATWILQKAAADCEGGSIAVLQRRGTRSGLATECLDSCPCSACAALLQGQQTLRSVKVCECPSADESSSDEEAAEEPSGKALDEGAEKPACDAPCCCRGGKAGVVPSSQLLEAEPQSSGLEYLLSFWVLSDKAERQQGGFALLNEIEGPHLHDVTALLAHPTEPCCFISASLDSRFSMWRRVAFPEVDTACALSGGPDSAAAEEGSLPSAFVCISQWDFRGLPVGCLAVSADGSLLAAGHGDLLSLWGSQGPSLIETLPLPALSAQAPAAEDSASEETQSYVRDVCCRSLHFIEAESGLLLVCAVSEYVLIYDLLDFAVVWKRDFVGAVDLVFTDGIGGLSVVEAVGSAHRLHVFSLIDRVETENGADPVSVSLPPLAEEREFDVSVGLVEERGLEDAVLAAMYASNPLPLEDQPSHPSGALLLLTSSFSLQRIYFADAEAKGLPASGRRVAARMHAAEEGAAESGDSRVLQKLLDEEKRLAMEERELLQSRATAVDSRSLAEAFCAKRSAEPPSSTTSAAAPHPRGVAASKGSTGASSLLDGEATAEAKLGAIFSTFTSAPAEQEPTAASASCDVETVDREEEKSQPRTVPRSLAGVETRKPKTKALKAIASQALKGQPSLVDEEEESDEL